MSRYRRLKIEGGAFFFTLALADRGGSDHYPDASVNERVGTARRAFAYPTLAGASTAFTATTFRTRHLIIATFTASFKTRHETMA